MGIRHPNSNPPLFRRLLWTYRWWGPQASLGFRSSATKSRLLGLLRACGNKWGLRMARNRSTAIVDNTRGLQRQRLWWSLLLAAMVLTVFLSVSSNAQAEWPDRVIRLIVPFGAGSSSDTIA